MKKYYMLLTGTMLLAVVQTKAQTKIGGAGAPDGSAMLEVTGGAANNKGLLMPRLTTTQRNAITSPATGLMIYNTTTNQAQVNTGTPAAPIWAIATTTTTGWNTTGNTGTTPATNFIGTADSQAVVIRTNNTEKVRVTPSGNVGIGIATPVVKLQVRDTGDVTMLIGTPNGNRGHIALGNGNHGLMRGLNGSGGDGNDIALYTSAGNAVGAGLYLVSDPSSSNDSLPLNQFVLRETGNIGIGTKDPTARLHLNDGGLMVTNATTALANPAIQVVNNGGGPGNNDNIVINSFGTNTQPSIGTQSSRGTFSAPQNSQAGDNIGNFFFNSRVNGSVANSNVIRGVYLGDGTTNKSRLNFFTSNAVGMTIDSNSFVGIGTTDPQQRLHVAGTARITGSSGTATTIAGRNAAGDVSNVAVGAGLSLTGGTLTATAGGNNWGLTGNTGTTPATNFIGTTDNQPLTLRTNNTEKVRVMATGYVGIGTAAPVAKLHVVDTGNTSIVVASSTNNTASVNLGNGHHGMSRNLTNAGGGVNDVALFTTSGSPTSPASIHLGVRATVTDTLDLNQFVLKNTGYVGIGTNNPTAKLHVDTGGLRISNGPTALANPAIEVINNGGGIGNNDNIVISAYGASTRPSIGTFTARGTASAPVNSQAGDNIGNFYFNAQVNGTSTNQNIITSAYLGDGTTNKSRLSLYTSNTLAMSIDSNQDVRILGNANLDGGVLVRRDRNIAYSNSSLHTWNMVNSGAGETEFINYRGSGSGGFRFYNVDQSDTASTANDIAQINTLGAYNQLSDMRLKTNVNTINGGLEKVMALRPVSYDFHTGRTLKDDVVTFTKNDKTINTIGFLAQELAKVVPEAVTIPKDPANELYTVSYTTLIPVLTKAIQELKTQVDDLKAENQKLKSNEAVTAQLMERVKQMEQMIGIKEIEGTSKVAGK